MDFNWCETIWSCKTLKLCNYYVSIMQSTLNFIISIVIINSNLLCETLGIESYNVSHWWYSKIGKWFTMMEWKPDLVGAIQECFIVFYLPLAWCFNMPLNSSHQHPPPVPRSFLHLHRVHCPLTAQLLRCHRLCVQMEIAWINIATYECWRIPHLSCLTNSNVLTP